LGKAINLLSGLTPILTGALRALVDVFQLLLLGRISGVIGGIGGFGAAASGAAVMVGTLVSQVALLTAGAFILGDLFYKQIPGVKALATSFQDSVLSLMGLNMNSIRAMEAQGRLSEEMGRAAAVAAILKTGIDEIPLEKSTEYLVEGTPEYEAAFDGILEQIKSIPAEKTTELVPKVNETEWKNKADFIINELPGATRADGTQEVITEIVFHPSLGGIDKTKEALEEIPSEKIIIARMDNQTDITIAEIKAMADTVQTSLEWKAKIEIAGIEELFETLRTQSESIRDMFLDTGEVITSITGAFSDLGPLGQSELMEILKKEMANRTALVEQQRLLTEAEVKYLEEKTKRLTEGQDGLITIQMDGVYPELELVLHKIIERTQVRATQEGLDFLLGV
jgi:hypothetical protein